jgi:hypothetical protein
MSVRIARVRFSKPTRLYAPANSRCQSALLGTAVALYLQSTAQDTGGWIRGLSVVA